MPTPPTNRRPEASRNGNLTLYSDRNTPAASVLVSTTSKGASASNTLRSLATYTSAASGGQTSWSVWPIHPAAAGPKIRTAVAFR